MDAEKRELEVLSPLLKQSGKYLYNEDGTPVLIGGKYLYLKEDGTTSLLDHHPSDNIESELARITGENAMDGMSLDLENTLDSGTTEPMTDDHRDDNADSAWNMTSTGLLLSLYKVMKELVDQGKIATQKRMWIKMAGRLQEHGYSFNPCQVENRYKTLLRGYRRKLEARAMKCGPVKNFPYERELKELYERDKRSADTLITPDGEQMTVAEFLEAAGLSGKRQMQFTTGKSTSRKVFTLSPRLKSKIHFKHPNSRAIAPAPKPAPPSPPYYTNFSRRADLMEELRDLRINTLDKLRTMEDKRDAFNKRVLEELRYRNELLEKLLDHVP